MNGNNKESWTARGLDINRLQESSGSDRDFEAELLEMFLSGCQTHLDSLPKALKRANKKDAHFHVHSIKGSALQLGACKVSQVCISIEKALAECNEGDPSVVAIESRCVELESAYKEYEKTYREYLKTPQ